MKPNEACKTLESMANHNRTTIEEYDATKIAIRAIKTKDLTHPYFTNSLKELAIARKRLSRLTLPQLMNFHAWFFGDDKKYMIEHILEYWDENEDAFKRYTEQTKRTV